MFYKYLTNKIGLSTNKLHSIGPTGPAPDLNYFGNIETCFYVHAFSRHSAGLQFLYSRSFCQTSVADRLFSFIFRKLKSFFFFFFFWIKNDKLIKCNWNRLGLRIVCYMSTWLSSLWVETKSYNNTRGINFISIFRPHRSTRTQTIEYNKGRNPKERLLVKKKKKMWS